MEFHFLEEHVIFVEAWIGSKGSYSNPLTLKTRTWEFFCLTEEDKWGGNFVSLETFTIPLSNSKGLISQLLILN